MAAQEDHDDDDDMDFVEYQAIVVRAHAPLSEHSTELTLAVGDRVVVVETDEQSGWIGGYREGDEDFIGWFPAHCIPRERGDGEPANVASVAEAAAEAAGAAAAPDARNAATASEEISTETGTTGSSSSTPSSRRGSGAAATGADAVEQVSSMASGEVAAELDRQIEHSQRQQQLRLQLASRSQHGRQQDSPLTNSRAAASSQRTGQAPETPSWGSRSGAAGAESSGAAALFATAPLEQGDATPHRPLDKTESLSDGSCQDCPAPQATESSRGRLSVSTSCGGSISGRHSVPTPCATSQPAPSSSTEPSQPPASTSMLGTPPAEPAPPPFAMDEALSRAVLAGVDAGLSPPQTQTVQMLSAHMAADHAAETARRHIGDEIATQEIHRRAAEEIEATARSGEVARMEAARAERRATEAETALRRMRSEAIEQQKSIEMFQADAERAHAEKEQFRAELARSQAEARRLQADAERANAQMQQIRADLASSQSDARRWQAEAERAQAREEQSRLELERSQAEARRCQAQLDNARDKYEAVRSSYDSVKKECQALTESEQRAKDCAEEAKQKAASLELCYEQLQARLEAPHCMETSSTVRTTTAPAFVGGACGSTETVQRGSISSRCDRGFDDTPDARGKTAVPTPERSMQKMGNAHRNECDDGNHEAWTAPSTHNALWLDRDRIVTQVNARRPCTSRKPPVNMGLEPLMRRCPST